MLMMIMMMPMKIGNMKTMMKKKRMMIKAMFKMYMPTAPREEPLFRIWREKQESKKKW